MRKDGKHIINLLLKSWGDVLSRKEKEELETLLEDPVWARLNADLLDDNFFMNHLREYKKYDVSGELVQFWNQVQVRKRHQTKRHVLWYCLGGAVACLIIFLGIGYMFEIFDYKVEQTVNKITSVYSGVSQDKIRLVLDDSDVINLTVNIKSDKLVAEGVVVRTEFQSLDYSCVSRDDLGDSLIYHTLIIPQGEIFKMILSDSTRIVLNGGTKIKYPVFFTGLKREVYIDGEAYFDVKKDKERPFIVSGTNFSVEVLGTSFNVMTYGEEMESNVTLVSGRIKMHAADTTLQVYPGQQVVLARDHEIIVRKVDVSSVISWLNLRLTFKKEKLATIMRKLSRWYKVDVVYKEPSVKEALYSGTIPYNISLEELFVLLNKTTNIEFTLNDGVIFINEKEE